MPVDRAPAITHGPTGSASRASSGTLVLCPHHRDTYMFTTVFQDLSALNFSFSPVSKSLLPIFVLISLWMTHLLVNVPFF